MIFEIVHAILGLAFGLFIPGFLLNLILFKEQELLERIALSVAFSISIDIFVGLLLGANLTMKNLTGGINVVNVWILILIISLILGGIYCFRRFSKRKEFSTQSLTGSEVDGKNSRTKNEPTKAKLASHQSLTDSDRFFFKKTASPPEKKTTRKVKFK